MKKEIRKVVILIVVIAIGIICYINRVDIVFLNVPKLKSSEKSVTKECSEYGCNYIVEANSSKEQILSYIEKLKKNGFTGSGTEHQNDSFFIYTGLFKRNNKYVYVSLTKENYEDNYNTEIHISNYDQWL